MKIAEVASKMGVTEHTISRWETGSRTPDISNLKGLALIYDCTIDELVNGLLSVNPTPPLSQAEQGETATA